MQYQINVELKVKQGEFWRDTVNKRWIVESVTSENITAISEVNSLPFTFTPFEFWRKFTFER